MDNTPTQPNPIPENPPNNTNIPPETNQQPNMEQPQFQPTMNQPTTPPPYPPFTPNQPQPVMPGYGAPQPQPQPVQPQPGIPKKPMDPKTKKTIILICSIGGGLLLLGIAALIILPIILKVDYKQTYDLAETSNDVRYDVQSSDSCGGVISYVDSTYQSKSSYEKYVSKCKSDLETFKKSINDLSGSSGVQRDTDIKKEWDAFKTSYDSALPAYEQLIDIYSDWHTFVAGWYEVTSGNAWHETMNETKVKNLTASLTESSNSALKKYGEGFVTVRWKQISTYQAYQKAYNAYYNASYNDPNKTALRNDMNSKQETYNGANQDFKDYITGQPNVKDTKNFVGIDLDKSEHQFLSKFSNVYSQISAKYIEQGFKDAIGL